MKIGIAGAGLVGRLAAWRLALSGHRVEVFDASSGPLRPSSTACAWPAAGWTAAGMLSPVAELETADEDVFRLGLRSLSLWEAYSSQLGENIGFRREGSLLLAYGSDAGSARRVVDQLSARAPLDHRPRLIDLPRLRELEPDIHGPALAWQLDGEGQVDAPRAMEALARAGTENGVTWHWNERVVAESGSITPLEAEGAGQASARHFDLVIDARGVGARPALPVRGVRGEIFWLHAPGVQLNRPVRLLHPRHRVYLVPRAGDLIIVGASEIESEDRSPPSVRSTVELLAAAHSVLPALAEARVVRSDVNLRPAMPDNLPVVVREDALLRINGLFRHGWLIAPALLEKAFISAGVEAGGVANG